MSSFARKAWMACAAIAIGLGTISTGIGAEKDIPEKVNIGAMITEIMKLQFGGNQQQLVLWMPFEFFVACGTSDGATWEEAEKGAVPFKDYHVLCVMREVTNSDGTSTFATTEQIQESVVLSGPKGEEIKPLTKVPAKISSLAAIMHKAMVAQGGAQAENMRLIFFPRKIDGKDFGVATEKGKFVVQLKEFESFEATTVTYHTPFDALHPQHPCATCKESISAKWSFCPFCGAKQGGE